MAISRDDKLDIQEEMFKLYRALDDHDPERFASFFLPDGVFQSRYGDYKGRSAISAFIRQHIEKGNENGARHFLNNFLFSEEAGALVARCYLVKFCFEEAKVWIVGVSRLAGHYVLEDSKWMIRLFELDMALKSPQRRPPY